MNGLTEGEVRARLARVYAFLICLADGEAVGCVHRETADLDGFGGQGQVGGADAPAGQREHPSWILKFR